MQGLLCLVPMHFEPAVNTMIIAGTRFLYAINKWRPSEKNHLVISFRHLKLPSLICFLMENKRDRNIYLRSWKWCFRASSRSQKFSEHATNLPSIPSMLASQLSFQLSTLSSLAQYSLFSNRKIATSSCKYLVDP